MQKIATDTSKSDTKDPVRLKPIEDQVIVIFGASSGMGRGTALALAERGAKLVLAARGEEGLRSLTSEISQNGGEAVYVVADTGVYEQVVAVAEQALSTYGRIDTWAHFAAVSIYATFEETTLEEFEQVVHVNLMGQVYGAKVALPHLRAAGGGALIAISSVESMVALPYQSAYAASKHGMKGFLDSLRLELEKEGANISVTNIKPTSINTPFFEKARTRLGVMPKGAPPIYQPETVIRAVLYAAEHPVPEIVVGDAGKLITLGKRFVPGLTDAFLGATAFRSQRTDKPKDESDPDNLYAPLPGYERVHGVFGGQSLPFEVANWVARRPGVKKTLWTMSGVWLAMKGLRILRG